MNLTLKGQCMRTDCAYHSKSVGSCDYLLIAGHRRGCSIEDCDKYRKKKKGDLRTPAGTRCQHERNCQDH